MHALSKTLHGTWTDCCDYARWTATKCDTTVALSSAPIRLALIDICHYVNVVSILYQKHRMDTTFCLLLPLPRRIRNCHCLSVCWQLCAKSSKWICMKFSGKVGNGPWNKWLNFGGSPGPCLDTGIVFRICHCWEIRKVVINRHKSAGHTDSPDGSSG